MKKYIAILPLAAYLSFVPSAFAFNACDPNGQFHILCTINAFSFGGVVGTLIQMVFIIAVLAALLYLIYGGFRWLISSGDKSNIGAAREHIVAAMVGLVIIFLSYFIINMLIYVFAGQNLSDLRFPSIAPCEGQTNGFCPGGKACNWILNHFECAK